MGLDALAKGSAAEAKAANWRMSDTERFAVP